MGSRYLPCSSEQAVETSEMKKTGIGIRDEFQRGYEELFYYMQYYRCCETTNAKLIGN